MKPASFLLFLLVALSARADRPEEPYVVRPAAVGAYYLLSSLYQSCGVFIRSDSTDEFRDHAKFKTGGCDFSMPSPFFTRKPGRNADYKKIDAITEEVEFSTGGSEDSSFVGNALAVAGLRIHRGEDQTNYNITPAEMATWGVKDSDCFYRVPLDGSEPPLASGDLVFEPPPSSHVMMVGKLRHPGDPFYFEKMAEAGTINSAYECKADNLTKARQATPGLDERQLEDAEYFDSENSAAVMIHGDPRFPIENYLLACRNFFRRRDQNFGPLPSFASAGLSAPTTIILRHRNTPDCRSQKIFVPKGAECANRCAAFQVMQKVISFPYAR